METWPSFNGILRFLLTSLLRVGGLSSLQAVFLCSGFKDPGSFCVLDLSTQVQLKPWGGLTPSILGVDASKEGYQS